MQLRAILKLKSSDAYERWYLYLVGPVIVNVNVVVCFTLLFFFTTARAERDWDILLSSFAFHHSEHQEEQHGDGRDSRQGYGGDYDSVDSVAFDEISSTGEEAAYGKESTCYYSNCSSQFLLDS